MKICNCVLPYEQCCGKYQEPLKNTVPLDTAIVARLSWLELRVAELEKRCKALEGEQDE